MVNRTRICSTTIIERGKHAKRSIKRKVGYQMVTLIKEVVTASLKHGQAMNKDITTRQVVLDTIIANTPEGDDVMAVFDAVGKGGEKSSLRLSVEHGYFIAVGGKGAPALNAKKPAECKNDAERFRRDDNKKQVGSRMGKLKKAMDVRLNPDKYAKTKERTDDNIKIPNMLADLDKRIKTSKDLIVCDAVELVEWMRDCPCPYAINDSE